MNELAKASVYEPERLKKMAEAERQRQVEAGITDDVEDNQPFHPPKPEALLNRSVEPIGLEHAVPRSAHTPGRPPAQKTRSQVEVLLDGGPKGARVHLVLGHGGQGGRWSDGQDVRSRLQRVLEYGAVRIKWPEDSEYGEKETYSWLLLRKNKWSKNVHYGWRYVHPDRTRLP